MLVSVERVVRVRVRVRVVVSRSSVASEEAVVIENPRGERQSSARVGCEAEASRRLAVQCKLDIGVLFCKGAEQFSSFIALLNSSSKPQPHTSAHPWGV